MVEILRLQLARSHIERTFWVELTFRDNQLIYVGFRGNNSEIEYEFQDDIGLEMLRISITFDDTIIFVIWDLPLINDFFNFIERLTEDAVIVTEEVEVLR